MLEQIGLDIGVSRFPHLALGHKWLPAGLRQDLDMLGAVKHVRPCFANLGQVAFPPQQYTGC